MTTTATIITLKYRAMTNRDLEIAYNRSSIWGEGDKCDEILAEMDRRAGRKAA